MLVSLDHDVDCDVGERILPYTQAREFVMKASPQIALMECPCRMSKPVHCEPTQVCMVFGGDVVMKVRPETSRRITTQEALELLEKFHKLGLVHTAYFKVFKCKFNLI